jgi:hypothetical protein
MQGYTRVALTSMRELLVFNIVGAVLALGALLLFRVPPGESFGFIILIESTALMLLGGALGVAGQATTRKVTELFTRRKIKDTEVIQNDVQAALYALTGVLLFVEVFGLFVILA